MLKTAKFDREAMLKAAGGGYINATDLADYLVGKGLPFRTAYKIVGGIVARASDLGVTLEELPLSEYVSFSDKIGEDVYDAISLRACVARRVSEGGTGASPASSMRSKSVSNTSKALNSSPAQSLSLRT